MIRLEDIFARRLEDVFKMSWRRLQDVLKKFLQDFLKTSWRRIAKTNIMVLTKTSSEDVRLRRTYSPWSKCLEDVLKTRTKDVFKTSSSRRMFTGILFPRNQVFCLKNWTLWRASTTIEFNIFYWNFAHVSCLLMSTKAYAGFFFIFFRCWIIFKRVKNACLETSSF